MMPTEPYLDVMRRSLANLKFVEDHAASNGPYEVTQLINSYLGALAFPWEEMRSDLNSMPLSTAESRGWPRIAKERSSDADPATLGDLIRYMRNSLAHGNIEFLPTASSAIGALRIWNLNSKRHRTWGAILTVTNLRSFLLAFAELIEEIHQSGEWRGRRSA